MERSLFERLQQQGAPVKMLSVQYRMHPAIRQVRPGAGGSCGGQLWVGNLLVAHSTVTLHGPTAQRGHFAPITLSVHRCCAAVPICPLLRRAAARCRVHHSDAASAVLHPPAHEGKSGKHHPPAWIAWQDLVLCCC